jgi:MFS family permease
LVLDALALLFAVLIYPIANSLHWLLPSLSPEVFRTAIVICLAMLSGFADPFIIVSAQTILQERVPNQEQGRVFGLQNTVQNMFAFLPVFIIGALDGILAVPVIISVLGALIAVMAFLGIYFFKTKNSAG